MEGKLTATRTPLIMWGILGVLLAISCGYFMFRSGTISPVFTVESPELKGTAIIPALQADVPDNMNIVWCASFLCAWKAMETELAEGQVSLEGAPGVLSLLQQAENPRPFIPSEALCVVTGWNHLGVQDRIRAELGKKFPTKDPPVFRGIQAASLVVYSYLEANVKFALPYFQDEVGLVFSDRYGGKSKVTAFGIRFEDRGAYFELRNQPSVLHVRRNDDSPEVVECVIDLDRGSEPNQVIVAMLSPDLRFGEKIAAIEKKIKATERDASEAEGLGPNDILLVPDIFLSIAHHYRDLEGRHFIEGPLKGQRIDVAEQDIQFRLDRSGAMLKSEAKLVAWSPLGVYIFNRPFLVYMKKRREKNPYFVLWVENAELLYKWESRRT